MVKGRLRKGHARPAGTTWMLRLRWLRVQRLGEPFSEPQIGDLVSESAWHGILTNGDELERGFVVVGVEEGRDREHWRVLLERLTWDDFLARVAKVTDCDRVWSFVRDRR